MIYTIGDLVVFRISDGAVWMVGNEEEKIILSPIVSRLLHFLLEENGRVLTRDEILDNVWSKQGLEASGNSLNQYISQIRKIFQNFGLSESTIKTIPRIGFFFDNNVSCLRDNTHTPPTTSLIPPEKIKIVNMKRGIFYFCFAIMWMSLIFIHIPEFKTNFIKKDGFSPVPINPYKIGEMNECTIYTIEMGNAQSPQMLSIAKDMLSTYGVDCSFERDVYFHSQNTVLNAPYNRLFISVCSASDSRLSSCKTILERTWQ